MVGRRVLVQKRRHVISAKPVEAFATVQGPNLGSDPAHHQVLEDPSHWSTVLSPFLTNTQTEIDLRESEQEAEIWFSG